MKKILKKNQQISEQNNEEQTALAQEAMDVRKKELDSDKAKQVERLNQTWDKLSAEKKFNLNKINRIGLKNVMLNVRCWHKRL